MNEMTCRYCKQNIRNTNANITTIETIVCNTLGIDVEDVYKKNRQRQIVMCRGIIWFFAKKIGWSLNQLGKKYGVHHTTVINSLKTLKSLTETDQEIKGIIDNLKLSFDNANLKLIKKKTIHK